MRALARGLNVLDYIARNPGVTFREIAEATGLSNAVVNRILVELVRSGFVWRGQSDRRFHCGPQIAATPGGSYAKLLAAAAGEPMSRLVERIHWPSDLFVRDGTEMVMVDSNRVGSPFHLRWSRIGRRAPMLLSSVGRAVLAALPPDDLEHVILSLEISGELKSQSTWLSEPLDRILAETRRAGFARREPRFKGPQLERHGETSIALAIRARGTVLGAINIWWLESADPSMVFPRTFLPELIRCRDAIEQSLTAATASVA